VNILYSQPASVTADKTQRIDLARFPGTSQISNIEAANVQISKRKQKQGDIHSFGVKSEECLKIIVKFYAQ